MAFAVLAPLLMVNLYRVFSLLWGRIMGTFKNTVNAAREARIKSIGLISIGLICGFLGSYGASNRAQGSQGRATRFCPGGINGGTGGAQGL